MISEDQVTEILSQARSLDEAAGRLIDAANENGGRDNITVILSRVEGDGEADEPDTLGGAATQVGVNADTIRAAVADAEAAETTGGAAATEEGEAPASADAPTIAQRPSEAREGREPTRVGRTIEGGVPTTSPIAARRGPPIPRRRRVLAAAGILLTLVAAVALVAIVNRQFWFVGTNDSGQVTIYRGLPYDLPLGIAMYDAKRTTPVPAAAIRDARQRKYVLDHHARGHDDSAALLRQIESSYSRP